MPATSMTAVAISASARCGGRPAVTMTEMLIPLRSPGTAYTVEGREPEEDGLRVGAGIACVRSSGISGSIQFGGEFRGDYVAHGVYRLIRYAF